MKRVGLVLPVVAGILCFLLHLIEHDVNNTYLHLAYILSFSVLLGIVVGNYRSRGRIWTRSGWVRYESDVWVYRSAHAFWLILGLLLLTLSLTL